MERYLEDHPEEGIRGKDVERRVLRVTKWDIPGPPEELFRVWLEKRCRHEGNVR